MKKPIHLTRSFSVPTLLASLLLAALALPAAAAPATYEFDKGHSTVQFRVLHLGVGYTYGRFNDFQGSFVVDDENLANAKVSLTVQIASVDSNEAKRDQHLKSPDFFNVGQFPTMEFKSTAVTKTAEGYRVVGDLKLHGITKSVALRMTKIGEGKDPWGNYRMGFEGQVVLKRSQFGMTHMLDGIGDDIYVTIAFEGIRK